jgi:methylated-DNA-[protein]-cysteine S-methyltransferase
VTTDPANPILSTQAISYFPCSYFVLKLIATETHLIGVEFLLGTTNSHPHCHLPATRNPILTNTISQLSTWFNNPNFTFSVPTNPSGTPFRKAVWSQISSIPIGSTKSYGEIAKQLGSSARAVGQACGDNPLPIIIPCHRIVSSTGLGGFNHSKGDELLGIKKWLLAREFA